MRITGGSARGRKLKSVKGQGVRPTISRVREALFDILAARIPGSRFLDLYAGVGAVGIEAASRGAARVVLVEAAPRHARVIQENIAALGMGEVAQVLRAAASTGLAALAARGECFDIVFLDPPYDRPEEIVATLQQLSGERSLVCAEGLVVVQHDSRLALPEVVGACRQTRHRRFGDSTLTFYELGGEGES